MPVNNFELIIYWATNFLCMFCTFHFLSHFLGQVRFPSAAVFAAFVGYALIIASVYFYARNPLLNLIANLLLCFAMGFLFKCAGGKRAVAAVLMYIMIIAAETGAGVGISWINDISIEQALSDPSFSIQGMLLSKVLLLIFSLAASGLVGRSKDSPVILPVTYWLLIVFIPGGSAFILYILVIFNLQAPAGYLTILIEAAVIVILLINCMVFYLYDKLVNIGKIRQENEFLIRQTDYYAHQIVLTESFQSKLKNLEHDLKNHLTTLFAMANNNESEEIKNYITTVVQEISYLPQISRSGNTTVDAILNSKLFDAGNQNIEVELSAKIPPNLKIADADWSILLGNLLDNAIEACGQVPDSSRRLHLKLEYDKANLVILLQNTYDSRAIIHHGGKYATTKKTPQGHGRGLSIIKNVVEKYGGVILVSHDEMADDNVGIFKVSIVMFV